MIICDPICTKMEHVPINTQIISNIVKEYKGKDIKLLCHESHWSHLSQSLSKEIKCSIKHIPIDVVSRKTKFKEWFKQLVTIRKIKSISSKNEPWIFLSTSVPLFWWFCFICKSHNPKMIFHSILAEVSGWIPRNPISALFTLRATFQNLHKRLPTTIVLEDYIRLNLIALNPQLQSKIFTLSHPLPDDNDTKITPNNKEIRIGFPGSFLAYIIGGLIHNFLMLSNGIQLVTLILLSYLCSLGLLSFFFWLFSSKKGKSKKHITS